MAERRQRPKTPRPRGFLLHRELSVVNYNVLNAPNSPAACASGSHAVRMRETVLRHITEKEAAARVEAQTQSRRGRLLQRDARERADRGGSRGSAASLEQKQQQKQHFHAVASSRCSPSHDEMEQDFSSSFGEAIEISEEDEAAFRAELVPFD
ncbi:hypothetical protein BC567DRAFT_211869 [Phyllosticta citribraziliensis]